MPMDSPQGGPALKSISVVQPGHDSQDISLHDLRPNTQPGPQSQYVQLNLNVICLLILVVD